MLSLCSKLPPKHAFLVYTATGKTRLRHEGAEMLDSHQKSFFQNVFVVVAVDDFVIIVGLISFVV